MRFMAQFPEMRDEGFEKVWQWIEAGGRTPLLNLGVFDPMLVGLFPCEAYDKDIWIHACFLKTHRGKFAEEAAQSAFEWIWKNTNYTSIKAYIEPDHVKRYAQACGMVPKGDYYEVVR